MALGELGHRWYRGPALETRVSWVTLHPTQGAPARGRAPNFKRHRFDADDRALMAGPRALPRALAPLSPELNPWAETTMAFPRLLCFGGKRTFTPK